MRLGKYIRDKLRPQIGVPIADDRKKDFIDALRDYTRCRDFDAKLTLVLKAICIRVSREAGNRRRPFTPAVTLPCTPREEIQWIRLRDKVESSFLRVLVDREVGELVEIGIDAYIQKKFGGVKGVQHEEISTDRSVSDSDSGLTPTG